MSSLAPRAQLLSLLHSYAPRIVCRFKVAHDESVTQLVYITSIYRTPMRPFAPVSLCKTGLSGGESEGTMAPTFASSAPKRGTLVCCEECAPVWTKWRSEGSRSRNRRTECAAAPPMTSYQLSRLGTELGPTSITPRRRPPNSPRSFRTIRRAISNSSFDKLPMASGVRWVTLSCAATSTWRAGAQPGTQAPFPFDLRQVRHFDPRV